MRTCIIFNPVARGDKARHFRDEISRHAAECAFKATTGPGAGRPLAAEAVREGFDVVVAAGGDGTLNEVLNGIGDVPGGFEKTALGLLPLGTVNVFAREMGLPMGLGEAWRVLQAGRLRTLDLGLAEFTASEIQSRRYFVQMAGAGMDARAVELVNWEYKKKVGKLAYIWAALQAMCGPLPRIRVTVGGETVQGELALVGNGRLYGGHFVLFPKADPGDGVLDVTVFPRVNWAAVVRTGWNALTGQSPAAGQAVFLRGPTVQLVADAPVPFHLEGDSVGHLPLSCSVRPGLLRVIVP